MMTMGIMSAVGLVNTGVNLFSGKTTITEEWPGLITSSLMIASIIMWPLLTRAYSEKTKKRRTKEIIKKYQKYLEQKKQELEVERGQQKDIILENLISVEDCIKIIQNKSINLWDKRIDQNDFLVVRIGIGNDLLDVKIEYPEEGFTIEEDELRKQADKIVENYKYIENIPISYSFYDNKITAIMGAPAKTLPFISNIILQLITFYSYEDLKLVVFTSHENEPEWQYIKYLNHNFNNERNFRFFAKDNETIKEVSEYLNIELNNRLSKTNNNSLLFKPHYFIIIDDYEKVKRQEFIKNLTETDTNVGFNLVILEERLSKLPSRCNNFITLGQSSSGVLKNSYERQEQITFIDEINPDINMMNISKILANIPIEFEEGVKNLPDSISFMEMEKVGKVEQLNILNRWNTNDSTVSLKAEIGVDEQGELMYLDLHEKYHGPHGLIAGTTGSGKSEFIITYILSMAINYSPDDVSFILIDYKGGGLALAFENKATGTTLPHLAGIITNLDKAEMDRTLVSINSELQKRQEIFNKARDLLDESTMDIYKYQKYYHDQKLQIPIPHLFIICDEFAELKAQQPEFMNNLISVARIGRSLGVHLILATQKPSGVVNEQIWSNTKFRVCLKVQDEQDSREMLKRNEAASLKQVGRFYLQVGYDEYFAKGQSAWCGTKYYPSETIIKQVDKSVNIINDSGAIIKSLQATTNTKKEPQGEQLSSILKYIIETSKKVQKQSKKLWLEKLPEMILVDNLEKKYPLAKESYEIEIILGEYDAPEKQEQGPVKYNYLTQGNTIIYGQDGSEKEQLLNTLIYTTSKHYNTSIINYYIIDYGSETLRKFQNLPHIGGIIYSNEEEKYNNLLKMLKEEIQQRKNLLADYGGEYINYLKKDHQLPLKVIILNNYDSIYESIPSIYDELPELVRDSVRYGIVFILTANAPNSVQTKISSNFPNTYTFKLKDLSDYSNVLGTRVKTAPSDIFARGLIKNEEVHEFQTASIHYDELLLNDYLNKFITYQNTINSIKAKSIPILPEKVDLNTIKEKITTINNIPIGISKKELETLTIDYQSREAHIITSTKLSNLKNFTQSLIQLFTQININKIVIDPLKEIPQPDPNYYTDNFEELLTKLNKYMEESKTITSGIILIYGLNKFITTINNNQKISEFISNIKKTGKITLIVAEDYNKLKNYVFESWFTNIFSLNSGIWIGRGLTDQNLIRLTNLTKDMTKDYKNDMGYLIEEGQATLCKLINLIPENKEE